MRSRTFWRWMIGLAIPAAMASPWCCPAPVQAGSFHVSPVRLVLSQAQPTTILTLQNDGDQATVVQLEGMDWSQTDGEDIYTPTADLLANPPIFTVPSGGTQIVRIGLRRPPDPQRELAYRLYLQEVPPPAKPGFQGLQLAIRVGVPIFVSPQAPAAPLLHWQAMHAQPGVIEVSLTNTGNVHVQVIDFQLSPPGNEQVLATQQAAAYLLPGQARRWVIHGEQDWQGGRLHVVARTDQGEITAEIDPAQP